MKLEIGKRYIRRDGSVTGPLEYRVPHTFPFNCEMFSYKEDGVYNYEPGSPQDLISEYVEPNLDNNLDSDLDKDARIADDMDPNFDVAERKNEELKARIADLNHSIQLRDACNEELRARVEELEGKLKTLHGWWARTADERDSLRTQLAAVTAERDENAAHYGYWQNEAMKASEELAAYKQPKLIVRESAGVYDDGEVGHFFIDKELSDRVVGYIVRTTYQNPDGSTYVVATLEPVTEESK